MEQIKTKQNPKEILDEIQGMVEEQEKLLSERSNLLTLIKTGDSEAGERLKSLEVNLDDVIRRNATLGIEKIRSLVDLVYESGEKGKVVAIVKNNRLSRIARLWSNRDIGYEWDDREVLSTGWEMTTNESERGIIFKNGSYTIHQGLSDTIDRMPIEIKPRGYEKEELDELFKELVPKYQIFDIIKIFPENYEPKIESGDSFIGGNGTKIIYLPTKRFVLLTGMDHNEDTNLIRGVTDAKITTPRDKFMEGIVDDLTQEEEKFINPDHLL